MVALNLNAIIKAENMGYKKEDLQNTWGIVESKGHARYIAVLADSHDFFCSNYESGIDNFFYIDDEDLDFLKSDLTPIIHGARKITIPLPPKADKQELSEWPQVGDEVQTSMGKGTVKLPPDERGFYVILTDGEYTRALIEQIKKTKTPEDELRDEIIAIANLKHPAGIAHDLMTKYNITKKV